MERSKDLRQRLENLNAKIDALLDSYMEEWDRVELSWKDGILVVLVYICFILSVAAHPR